MFYFSKIMTSFLLPPGIFLLIGLGALFLPVKIHRNIFLTIYSIFLLLIYLLSIRPISDWCLSPLEDKFPLRDDSLLSAQYIVILGGSSVNRFDHLTLSSDAAKRVVEGYILHRKTGLPIILSGGSVLKGEEWPSEAEIGTALLLKLGMGSEYIYREEKSRNTFENAHYIKDRFNPKSVVLVTSAYHMKRSVAVFQKLDIPVIPYPVDFKTEDRKYQFLDFLPSMDSLRNSYYAFHEYIGMGYYAIRYLFS